MGRPYAEVIGDPIAHSKSPLIHNFWLGKLGIDAEYRACHVRAEQLEAYLGKRNADDNWCGCNVTMPHKQVIIPFLDRLDSHADAIGAVNTVTMEHRYLVGGNTDAQGFLEPLAAFYNRQLYRIANVVGSGGAARAIAQALDSERFTIISFSRDPAKADREIGRYIWDKDLLFDLDDLHEPFSGPQFPADGDRIDVFVNASAMGMTGYPPLAPDFRQFAEDLIVYDIVTSPLETPLLAKARAEGLRTIDGLAMLIGQAAVAFEKFFGQPAPRQYDAELRSLLTR